MCRYCSRNWSSKTRMTRHCSRACDPWNPVAADEWNEAAFGVMRHPDAAVVKPEHAVCQINRALGFTIAPQSNAASFHSSAATGLWLLLLNAGATNSKTRLC